MAHAQIPARLLSIAVRRKGAACEVLIYFVGPNKERLEKLMPGELFLEAFKELRSSDLQAQVRGFAILGAKLVKNRFSLRTRSHHTAFLDHPEVVGSGAHDLVRVCRIGSTSEAALRQAVMMGRNLTLSFHS